MATELLTMHSDLSLNAQRVKQAATNAGFELVGIAKAESTPEEYRKFEEWLSAGYHATMTYLERNSEKRKDIRAIMPEAKSVIVVGRSYYTPQKHEVGDDRGKISRYAWGTDYHELLPNNIQDIIEVLHTIQPGSISTYYVDTGPVSEKQWARKAGIGWQGKHSNIISRDIGSWFFIGVIITSVELAHDQPIQDYCGTCTACMEACPTSAIVEPYTVDAGKCLSYWTIEAKPEIPIPNEISQNMDQWIFGCDICQDVCPWNSFAKETTMEEFYPRHGQTTVLLNDIISMEQSEFSDRFRKSPLKRTKLAGLQRNVEALLHAQKDADELV